MIEYITFADKNINNFETNILIDSNINQIKHKSNYIIDFFNLMQFPVESVLGATGNIEFDFPVSSVNGLSGNVLIDINQFVTSVNGKLGNVQIIFPVSSVNDQTGIINIEFPVSSVNTKTGHINFIISDLQNDTYFITKNDIPVLSVNTQKGDVNLKISHVQNDKHYIIANDLKVLSVNNKIGNVLIQYPVNSVNNRTGDVTINIPVSLVNTQNGDVNLKISHVQNDKHYIIASDLKVLSVNNKIGNVLIQYPVNSVNNRTGDVTINIPVLSVNTQKGDVNLKTSQIQNDRYYITIDNILITSVNSTNIKQNQNLLNKNIIIYVPNKISQLENDLHFYNNITNFLKVRQNNQSENDHQFISFRLEKIGYYINTKCIGCGDCQNSCNYGAIKKRMLFERYIYTIDAQICINCGQCVSSCSINCIEQGMI